MRASRVAALPWSSHAAVPASRSSNDRAASAARSCRTAARPRTRAAGAGSASPTTPSPRRSAHPKIRFLPNASLESVDGSGARVAVKAAVRGPGSTCAPASTAGNASRRARTRRSADTRAAGLVQYAVDVSTCRAAAGEECDLCAKACPVDAIDATKPSSAVRVAADGVLVATGHGNFDPVVKPRLGYRRLPNVMTGFEAEQALAGRLDLGGRQRGLHPVRGIARPEPVPELLQRGLLRLRPADGPGAEDPQPAGRRHGLLHRHPALRQGPVGLPGRRGARGREARAGHPVVRVAVGRAAGPGHRRSRHRRDHRDARHRGALGGHAVRRRRGRGGCAVRPGTGRVRILRRGRGGDAAGRVRAAGTCVEPQDMFAAMASGRAAALDLAGGAR